MNDDFETVIGVGTSGIECPKCHHINPPGSVRCVKCSAPIQLEVGSVTTTGGGGSSGWSQPAPESEAAISSLASLKPGSVLGGRYEIIKLLGEGGMGAVYKAQDRELERLVAIKVIRPELAGQPEILKRFKQELILARKVTHKNVIRIFDLGQAEGIKFITMEYVEGADLKHVLRGKGKLPPEEAVGIIRQVCLALDAAHAEGVVHRDLKPQNIMIDEQGKILVMDFGIARSMEMSGMTQTGALIGTPEYMSPEQARGEKIDQRSDLFTLGIIFYELLTGKSPYKSDTAMGTLLKRIQERAVPPIEVETTLPKAVSDIVAKCLERELTQRYQTAAEMLADIELWAGPPPGTVATGFAPVQLVKRVQQYKWAAAGLAALLLVVAGVFVFREKTAPKAPAGKQKVVTLLVADFKNDTGDAVFDGTLEPMFTLAMEGASFITSTPRNQALRAAAQVQAGATKIDEALARLVAVREAINVVVTGSIARQGEGYVVAVKAIDAVTGKQIASQETKAANKEKVLATVGKLAAPIRKALGDMTPESAQLEAAETFTASSVEGAHEYSVAQELRLKGEWKEALTHYTKAVEFDPNFASAYASLAATYLNLGQPQMATKYYEMTMARSNRMTDREKHRARGLYYVMSRNPDKAIEEFTALVKQYPADAAGLTNLAQGYYFRREMAKALEQGRRTLEIYPKNSLLRNNVAYYAMYAGDFEAASKDARAVIEANASYMKAYIALALSELAQGRPAQAVEVYKRLEVLTTVGSSFAAAGLADVALYEGRTADAAAILNDAVSGDLASNAPAAAARKFVALAEANLALGRKGPALTAADRAVTWSKEISALFLAARTYLETGQEGKARNLAADLGKRLEPDPQAYAKLIEGEVQLKKGNAREAAKLFQEAQKLADTWLGHFDLGRAYLDAGAFTEADAEFDRCQKRRGEATEVFLDELPTYHYFPAVLYWQGRAQEGLKSPAGAESYKAYLAIREKSDNDPLAKDARQRLTGR